MNVLIRLSMERARQFETELVLWIPSDSEDAEFVCILEEFMRQCIQLGELMGRTWAHIQDDFFNGKLQDITQAKKYLEAAFNATEAVFVHLEKSINDAKRRKYVLEQFDDWWIEFEALKRQKKEFYEQWPRFDQQTIEASLADLDSGNFRDAEELLNDAKGHRSEDNQQ